MTDVMTQERGQSIRRFSVVLESAESEPPEGRVEAGRETARFYGWLGLVRALADAVARAPSSDDVDPLV